MIFAEDVTKAERPARIRPILNQVLVKRFAPDEEKVTASGLIIPDTARDNRTRAVVMAVGPGAVLPNGKRREPQVKPGDVVIVDKWTGYEVRIQGVEHHFIVEDQILAVLEVND